MYNLGHSIIKHNNARMNANIKHSSYEAHKDVDGKAIIFGGRCLYCNVLQVESKE